MTSPRTPPSRPAWSLGVPLSSRAGLILPIALGALLLGAPGCGRSDPAESAARPTTRDDRAAAPSNAARAAKANATGQPAAAAAAPAAGTLAGGPMRPRPPLPKARAVPTGSFFGLGPIQSDKDTRKQPFYPGPKPPPRVGEVIDLPVPPPAAPSGAARKVAAAAAVPLTVARVAPNGRVGVTNAVSAQFNQPMVPVGSLNDLKRWPVPLQLRTADGKALDPALKLKARWLGTRTVALESPGRLPFSTKYEAKVPAGTASATGQRLKEAETWSFETPRLRASWRLPTGGQVRPEAVVAITFNQDIDPKKVAEALILRHKSETYPLAQVPHKAWKTLPRVGTRLANANRARTVVVRPTRLLPVATGYVVELPKGSYAAEGPLPTERPIRWSFSTYPKLTVVRRWCQWRDKVSECREGNPITIQTSTTIDGEQDLRAVVSVKPEPPDLRVVARGRNVVLTGGFAASTTYRVTVKPGLRDVFGQTLGTTWRQTFAYPEGVAVLQLPSTAPVVLEATAPGMPQLNARVRNLDKLQLAMRPIGPAGLHKAYRVGGRWVPAKTPPLDKLTTPGFSPIQGGNGQVLTRTLRPRLKKNQLGVVKLDLKPALRGRRSGVIAVSVGADWPHDRGWFSGKTAYARLLVQVTDVGITARWDKTRLVAYVARLSTGAPLAGARVQLVDGKGKTLQRGQTDAKGVLTLPCDRWSWRDSRFLWVEAGPERRAEVAYLRLARRVNGPGDAPKLRTFVWTDRVPYKPGEVAQISALLRSEDPSLTGGVGEAEGAKRVRWRLRSARGIELAKGVAELGPGGAMHLNLPLPADMDLGAARFEGTVEGGRFAGKIFRHSFQVQHYRAPEFKVAAAIRPAPEGAGAASTKGGAAAASASVLRFGGDAELSVSGRYYFGAAMAGARAHYVLRRTPTRFAPPKHSGWTFGRAMATPWWRRGRGGRSTVLSQGDGHLDADGRWLIRHLLDPRDPRAATGKSQRKSQKFKPITGPASYQLEAWVEDDARQRITARAAAVVHQGATYAGLKLSKSVLKAGQKVTLSVVAADVSGRREARAVAVRLVRLEPKRARRYQHGPRFGRGRPWQPWVFDEVEVARCTAKTTLALGVDKRPKPATCVMTLPSAGSYRFIAQVRDDTGAMTTSHIGAYAYGPKRVRWAVHDMGKVELVADKASYEPGETATVLIKSPFAKAHGLLTVERNGLLSHRVVAVPNGAAAVQLKLDPRWVPNATVRVTLFAGRDAAVAAARAGGGKVADAKARTATGSLSLPIALSAKRIVVGVKPARDVLAPGEQLDLAIETKDAHGKPLPSRLTVWAVDEGVLALLGYQTPAPLPFFHHSRSAHTAGDDLRARILVERFAKLVGLRRRRKYKKERGLLRRARATITGAFGGGGRPDRAMRKTAGAPMPAPPSEEPEAMAEDEGALSRDKDVGGGGPAPALRALFASTAFFKSGVTTDASGAAKLSLKLPDNTTTFRIMVVAEQGEDRFGSGQGQLTTRQPVLLRAALPRFANLHDDFDAAAVLHNETGARQTFVVGARATHIAWHDAFEKTVTLDAGASTEVRFRVRATETGRATFQFAARVKGSKRKDYADAVQRSIPINLPATLEAFATYGSTTSSVKQPVQAPQDAIANFGGLNVQLSSTALSGLEDAARYLVTYPYECAEQTASRLIPIVMLGELLDEFEIGEVADKAKRLKLITAAVKRLVGLQHYDGGFRFWPKARRSSRWVTPWVTYALLLAKEQGAEVPRRVLDRAHNYLWAKVRYARWSHSWWRVSDTLSLWVLTHPISLARNGAKSPNPRALSRYLKPFARLYGERAKLPVFARAWLMTVAHRLDRVTERDELLRALDNSVVEKAGTAHIAEGKSEDLRVLMHSSDRTDAIALAALVEVKPSQPLMGKLIRGLMDARIKGRWSTTQANAWAVVAARRYFDVFEKVRPNFTAQLWLGSGYLGTGRFKGRSLAKVRAQVPMAAVLKRAKTDGHTLKLPAPTPTGKASAAKVVDLVLAKRGAGRMYYRVGMRYAPKSLRLPAAEQGFTVQRSYEALNPKEKGRVQQLDDGSWRVRAGTDVRVKLTIVVPTRGHYVVVDDPLPAGFEPQNPAFRTTGSSAAPNRSRRGGGWRWYHWWRWNHLEMRDDRVLLFADRLWSGVYSHSYVARATSVGRFVVPPARAEEMYAPETFGRTATTFVEVVP